MKPGLTEGVASELEVVVTPDMCPAFDGVVVHKVYSTWSLAHHMEIASRKVLVPFLEAHEEGLGVHLSIDHIGPTPLGKTVRVTAVATKVDGPRLTCKVEAFDGERLVAHGSQVQRVLPRETIQALIRRYQ